MIDAKSVWLNFVMNIVIFRCELVITANGKTEKLASGLLNPFLAHLKTAQDQIAKGGYSITLEPDHAIDAFWFTKGTVERSVIFLMHFRYPASNFPYNL